MNDSWTTGSHAPPYFVLPSRSPAQQARAHSPVRVREAELRGGSRQSSSPSHRFIASGGRLVIELTMTPDGLMMQRDLWCTSRNGEHVETVVLFDSTHSFRLWLDQESLRFEDPLVHHQLQRQGEELLDGRD